MSDSRLQETERHWWCCACGTFDGPIAGRAFCDVCADGSEVEDFVPRAVAEHLADALEAITRDDCMLSHGETGSWIDTEAPARIAENALEEFRARYPGFADAATVEGPANPPQTLESDTGCDTGAHGPRGETP